MNDLNGKFNGAQGENQENNQQQNPPNHANAGANGMANGAQQNPPNNVNGGVNGMPNAGHLMLAQPINAHVLNGQQNNYHVPPPLLNGFQHVAAHYPDAYYGQPVAIPPPAHYMQLNPGVHHHPIAAEEAPALMPQAPPVPSESLILLLQRHPVMWQGKLSLKNDTASVQLHFVAGNSNVARDALPYNPDGSTPPLKISQRMQLETSQIESVVKKMEIMNEHCMLLALPCGRDHIDVLNQSDNLHNGFISYLNEKQAAGIVNVSIEGSDEPAYVVHIFSACGFAVENLRKRAPCLFQQVTDISHLILVITTL